MAFNSKITEKQQNSKIVKINKITKFS